MNNDKKQLGLLIDSRVMNECAGNLGGSTPWRLCYAFTLSVGVMCYLSLYYSSSFTLMGTSSVEREFQVQSSEDTATSSEAAEEEAMFLRMAEQRHKERVSAIHNSCRMFNKTNCSRKGKTVNIKALFSNNYQYVACPINKVSSTSWLHALSIMEDLFPIEDYIHKTSKIFGDQFIHHVYKQRSMRAFNDVQEALATWDKYLKIVTVRNPFHRLVSAYNGKMRPQSDGFTHVYGPISRTINQGYRHLRADGGKSRGQNDTTATFEDFVNFLIHHRGHPRTDPHWESYEVACNPCLYDYDVIIKFETFQEDMRYLDLRLNVSDYHKPAFFPARRPRTDNGKVEEMFKTIPRKRALRLYEMFKLDFMMFGYERPKWLDEGWDC